MRNYIHGELSEWSKVQHSKFIGLVSVLSTKNPVFMRGHAVRKTKYFAVLSVSSFQKFFLCKKYQENGGLTYTEAYRSGHNGPDSKDSIPKVRTSANFSDCTRDPPGSNFHKFISFLRVVLLFSKTGYTLRYTEGYRSGHNGADSKSVWVKAHVGSNPTPSARTQSYQGFQPI